MRYWMAMTMICVLVIGSMAAAQPPGPPPTEPEGPGMGRGRPGGPGMGGGRGGGMHMGPGGRGMGRGPGGGMHMGPGGHGRGWMDKDARELMDAVMIARLSNEMGLDDEKAVLLARRVSEYKERLGNLRRGRHEKMKALHESIQSEASDEAVEKALDALLEQDRLMAQAQAEMIEKTGEGLDIRQKAKLYVFLSRFENEMRELIRGARQRSAGMGGMRGGMHGGMGGGMGGGKMRGGMHGGGRMGGGGGMGWGPPPPQDPPEPPPAP